ncbi:murein L,D-transpeptidase YcbB/YkuD [Natronoflexus pectinivorans]|uniref:Murein L,D-transpeptidase YcbB/YkuD n=2 Tax=Natronoflexus pectinivorans TaxID=682526 RepID=A0A4R2GE39_9BACT|nr:murein L,D-transpeptidase YcbB/YkuD [Natronoflexus pectinivorans]
MFSPLWRERENIDQLMDFLREVHLEGLNPEDYHMSKLELLMEKIVDSRTPDTEDLAELELLLTDSYLLLASHLGSGKTDSETIDPQWHAIHRNPDVDWVSFVDSTLRHRVVKETLQSLTPSHREYSNLKKALAKYVAIEEKGGWDSFNTSLRKLEKGINHPDVALLRTRLSVTQGDITFDSINENYFDEALHQHVVLFQMRNGLTADGVVGRGTIDALNIPVEERVASIRANLERWRWLSDDLGDRHILVNIANFELLLIENGETIFKTEAIVGRPYRRTPVFSSRMTYLVFNPDWTIPPTILRNDVIPAVINNPNYLNQRRMRVITRSGENVDPSAIDWQRAATSGFPYMIRQDPGPDNALGLVKFMFPNHHNVYIHDTPSRELFRQTERSFSSGCIRINQPMKLAEILLDTNPGWDMQRINQTLAEKRSRTVHLQRPVPVHLLYLTAWADDEGIVYFRRDIYNRDEPLLIALRQSTKSDEEI